MFWLGMSEPTSCRLGRPVRLAAHVRLLPNDVPKAVIRLNWQAESTGSFGRSAADQNSQLHWLLLANFETFVGWLRLSTQVAGLNWN
jgi:hypothetical protein